MPVGLGVDIVEIDRMRRILDRTPSFARKVFTQGEQDYCNAKANPATHYAARFAAKEAVCKALGTGILTDGITMQDVEVIRDSRGKPAVALHGAAARIAADQGVVDVPLSLTYTHSVAVANAVAITKASQAEREKHRDVKAELAQQFKELRGMLDDLSGETASAAHKAQEADAQEPQEADAQESADASGVEPLPNVSSSGVSGASGKPKEHGAADAMSALGDDASSIVAQGASEESGRGQA